MPANLTPEYKAAEAAYRRAREPRERLDHLRHMLRAIPKHKGTDHLQADIKTRIKELTEELAGPKKAGGRSGPQTVFSVEGAAQIALVGAPNVGKSALHARLTGSHVNSAEYPFATQYPQPGMLGWDDVFFQLIDQPSVAAEHPIPWIGNALQPAEGCLLVVDLTNPGCVERVLAVHEILAERKVVLVPTWPHLGDGVPDTEDDLFTKRLPTLLVVNKSDLLDDVEGELEVYLELSGLRYPVVTVSAETGQGLDDIGRWLFDALGVVRVYTKVPGQEPDMTRPFTMRPGDTVHHVAVQVHKDVAASLRFAKIWGPTTHDGQHVGPDHEVVDGDILELHT